MGLREAAVAAVAGSVSACELGDGALGAAAQRVEPAPGGNLPAVAFAPTRSSPSLPGSGVRGALEEPRDLFGCSEVQPRVCGAGPDPARLEDKD